MFIVHSVFFLVQIAQWSHLCVFGVENISQNWLLKTLPQLSSNSNVNYVLWICQFVSKFGYPKETWFLFAGNLFIEFCTSALHYWIKWCHVTNDTLEFKSVILCLKIHIYGHKKKVCLSNDHKSKTFPSSPQRFKCNDTKGREKVANISSVWRLSCNYW